MTKSKISGQAMVNASPAGTDVAISIHDLSFSYNLPRRPPIKALDDINLEISRGEFISLLGPSGCGKSTLLYLIGGFIPIGSGLINVDGDAVTGPGPSRGIVFQHFALFPWKSVCSNVCYALEKRGVPRSRRRDLAQTYIDMVNLTGFEDSYPSQLSGGMKQRAAIARTLAMDADYLLMDEPFGSLDAQTRIIMQEELLGIWQKTGKTVIFVTHDVQEAVYLAQRVVVMSARPGRIKSIIETDFAKLGQGAMKTPEFIEKSEFIWGLVREEARAAQKLD